MVGINIPVSVEVLPESLRKISRDINNSVQNISPELNVDTSALKRAIGFGLEGLELDIRGLSDATKTIIGSELNKLAILKINKATVTADAKKQIADDIIAAARDIEEIQLDIGITDLERQLKAATQSSEKIKQDFIEAGRALQEAQARAAQTRGAFQQERAAVGDAPLQPGVNIGELLERLEGLDELEAESKQAAAELQKASQTFNTLQNEFVKLGNDAQSFSIKIDEAKDGSEELAEAQAELGEALRAQDALITRESNARMQAISALVRNSEDLRSLSGNAKKEADEALKGIDSSKSLSEAKEKIKKAFGAGLEIERKENSVAAGRIALQIKANKALKNKTNADRLVANIGKNAAKRRKDEVDRFIRGQKFIEGIEKDRQGAIKASVKAFTDQTREVIRGKDAQQELIRKVRDAINAQRKRLGGAGAALPSPGGIGGGGGLQQFAQGLDPKQLQAFQGVLNGVSRSILGAANNSKDFNKRLKNTNLVTGRVSKTSKGFSGALKNIAGSAFLAFKRLLLYTIISQIIFGVVKSIKEAVAAVIELDTEARRIQNFANIAGEVDDNFKKVNATINSLQDAFDAVTTTALKFGITLQQTQEGLLTVVRVGQDVNSVFAQTVFGLVRLEGGALSADSAVRNLNAIQEQFLRGLDRQGRELGINADKFATMGREANISARFIQGLGATLFVAASQSSLNVSQLSDVAARVGAAFSNLQKTDPVTLITLIGKAASVSGAQVGRLATGLKQAATLIIQNAEDVEALTGIKVFDQGSIRGLPAILDVLEAAADAGAGKQRAILGLLFDRRSLDIGAALAVSVKEIREETKGLASDQLIAQRVFDNTIKFLESQENVSGGLDAALNRLDVTIKSIVTNDDFTNFLARGVDLFTKIISEVTAFFGPLNNISQAFGSQKTVLQLLSDVLIIITGNFEFFAEIFKRNFFGGFIKQAETAANTITAFINGLARGEDVTKLFGDALGGLADITTLVFRTFIINLFPIVALQFKLLGAVAGSGFIDGILDKFGQLGKIIQTVLGALGGGTAGENFAELANELGDGFAAAFKASIEESSKVFIGDVDELKKAAEDAKRTARLLEAGEARESALAFFLAQEEKITQENEKRVLVEKAVNQLLAERRKLLQQLLEAGEDNLRIQELENRLRIKDAAIFATFDERSQALRAFARERLALERDITLEQERQVRAFTALSNLQDILNANLTGEQKLELELEIQTTRFDAEIKAATLKLAKLTAISSLSTLTVDEGERFENVQKAVKAEKALEDLKAKQAVDRFKLEEKIVELAFKRTQEQIKAWETAANKVAEAFKKVVNLQKGLADIFNKAGELAGKRLENSAQLVNEFLERTGASIEARILATRRQSEQQLTALRRSGENQLASLEDLTGNQAFGDNREIQANVNRLIDAIISANKDAQDKTTDEATKSINIEAAARRQVANELRAEFELRVNATRNEIAVRQRLLSQEISILQERISAERRFAELREDQQRQFGRLLIDSPKKFAETLEDFRFAQQFFQGISDVNLGGLQQVQGRLAQLVRLLGPEAVSRIVRGVEAGAKFGLQDLIPGVGNILTQGVIERLVLQTPKELNRSLQEQRRLAKEQTAEQKRIRELQNQQADLLRKDAELQKGQIDIAVLDANEAKRQRAVIISLLQIQVTSLNSAKDSLNLIANEARIRAVQNPALAATFSQEEIDRIIESAAESFRQSINKTEEAAKRLPGPIDKVIKKFSDLDGGLERFNQSVRGALEDLRGTGRSRPVLGAPLPQSVRGTGAGRRGALSQADPQFTRELRVLRGQDTGGTRRVDVRDSSRDIAAAVKEAGREAAKETSKVIGRTLSEEVSAGIDRIKETVRDAIEQLGDADEGPLRSPQDIFNEALSKVELLKPEKIEELQGSIKDAITEGTRELIEAVSTSIGDTIITQLKNNRVRLDLPEFKISFEGRVTQFLEGTQFAQEIGAILSQRGLTPQQIDTIRNRLVALSKNQRNAGADIEFDGELD